MHNLFSRGQKITSFIILVIFFIISFSIAPASATTWVQTSQSDFSGNTLTNMDLTTNSGTALISHSSHQYNEWTSGGIDVATGTNEQNNPNMVSDGSGGTFITWGTEMVSNTNKIYLQRIDSTGNVASGWPAAGIVVSTATVTRWMPEIISDGSGGVIIAWEDLRNGTSDIYAQRINSSGTAQWTANGIAVATGAQQQAFQKLVSDGNHGAVITWDGDQNIYAQRIYQDGSLWSSPTTICDATGNQLYPQIASDGNAGAIITWQDNRGANRDIYAQLINSSGSVQWTANGIIVNKTTTNHQEYPKIVADNAGGAIIAWQDNRGTSTDIYAQHLNSSGTLRTSDIAVTTATNNQTDLVMASDTLGGAFIAWNDNRNSDNNIYAQRLQSDDTIWVSDAVISNAAGDDLNPQITADGEGGAIVVWGAYRSSEDRAYVQRINSTGSVLWASNGISMGSGLYYSDYTVAIASSSAGVAIIIWYNTSFHLISQKVKEKPIYSATGNMISSVFDAGQTTNFTTISWSEIVPSGTNITFQTRTCADNTWTDEFDDGITTNIDSSNPPWAEDFQGGAFTGIIEADGKVTFSNPMPTVGSYPDYYFLFKSDHTGESPSYYPAGSIITITYVLTSSSYFYLDLYSVEVENEAWWDDGALQNYHVTGNINDQTMVLTTSEDFNDIGFNLYEENGDPISNSDTLAVKSITIEAPTDSEDWNWSAWSDPVYDTPAGSDIVDDPTGQYIQYKANFSTSDTFYSPTLYDVTLSDESNSVSADVNVNAQIPPSLSLSISPQACNFESLDAFNLKTCNYTTTASTNGTGGYTLYLRADGSFRNSIHEIANVSDGAVTATSEEYGFAKNLTAEQCAALSNQHASQMTALVLSTDDQSIDTASGPVDSQHATICHAVGISGTTPAGYYSQISTLTIVSNY